METIQLICKSIDWFLCDMGALVVKGLTTFSRGFAVTQKSKSMRI